MKVKILLLGPGHGSNISAVLEMLCSNSQFEVSLLTASYDLDRDGSHPSHVYEFGSPNKWFRRARLIKVLRGIPPQDIFIILGGGNPFEDFPSWLMIKRKHTVFNIWSEYLINSQKRKSLKTHLYGLILESCNIVWCNWQETANMIFDIAPSLSEKVQVHGWGLSSKFCETQPISTDFCKEFIGLLPKEKSIFINMRSLSSYNAIDVILQASLIIRENYPDHFKQLLVIFWHGNLVNETTFKTIQKHIDQQRMRDTIWCVKHPFVPVSDLRHIIDSTDVVMNYVYHDQLSLSLLEAMYLKKQIIASDIRPYRLFNELFDSELKLTALTVNELVDDMLSCIEMKRDPSQIRDILEKRHQIVLDNYSAVVTKKHIHNMLIRLVANDD